METIAYWPDVQLSPLDLSSLSIRDFLFLFSVLHLYVPRSHIFPFLGFFSLFLRKSIEIQCFEIFTGLKMSLN